MAAPYLRPNWFLRVVANPLVKRLGVATELMVRGRRSGEPRRVPVNVIEVDGARYLVSPRGETEWVRNLRAAGEGELRRRGSREAVRAIEVPTYEREPVIAANRERWDWQVGSYFRALPDPADHPVFRIEPDRSDHNHGAEER